jgi:mannosyltransferase OCH1-like enzyme
MYDIIIIIILILLIYYLLFNKSNINNFDDDGYIGLNKNIPKVLYLTYKKKNIPSSVIDKFKEVYPDYQIKIYDNNDCVEFLEKEFGQEYVDIFNFIKDGPIKADFWRVCILYKYGGIYSDIDIIPVINIEEILLQNTTFLSCISFWHDSINPIFIVSVKEHLALKMCIDKYVEFYRTNKEYSYWGWSIMHVMKPILCEILNKCISKDGIYHDKKNNQYQFLKQVHNFKLKDILSPLKLFHKIQNMGNGMYNEYNKKIILYDKNDNYANHSF